MDSRFRTTFVLIVAVASLLAAAGCTEQSKALLPPSAQAEENRRLVLAFHDAFFNRRDLRAAERYIAEAYREHSPARRDGRAALMDFYRDEFAQRPQQLFRVARSAVDNDTVFLHLHVKASPEDRGRAVVDIYRVEEGRIVEHWSVEQPVPEAPANANPMF